MSTRPPYPTTYQYAESDYGARRQRFPGDKLVIPLVEACLESGMTSAEAVTFAIETHRELDKRARVEDGGKNLPPYTEIVVMRRFVIAVLRSGKCQTPYDAASRAIAAWKQLKVAGGWLKKEWLEEEKKEAGKGTGKGRTLKYRSKTRTTKEEGDK